jgi:hypothetical protein
MMLGQRADRNLFCKTCRVFTTSYHFSIYPGHHFSDEKVSLHLTEDLVQPSSSLSTLQTKRKVRNRKQKKVDKLIKELSA